MDMNTYKSWLLNFFLILNLYFGVSSGYLGLLGNVFTSYSELTLSSDGALIMNYMQLQQDAMIVKIKTHVIGSSPAWLQVWRARDPEQSHIYTLVDQRRFTSRYYPNIIKVDLLTDRPLLVQRGDVLGLFFRKGPSPISYRIQTDTIAFHSSVDPNTTIDIGDTVLFSDMAFPYEFSLQVYFDTDVDKYLETATQQYTTELANETMDKTPSTSPSFTNGYSYTYIGNSLENKHNHLKTNARGVYILPQLSFDGGAVIKFLAYFIWPTPVYFQVWRPIESNRYILVGQYFFHPTLVPDLYQLDLSEDEYIPVEEGDVLGLTFINDTGSIGYRFLGNPTQDGGPLRATFDTQQVLSIGSVLEFNMQQHPLDFAIGAFVDEEMNISRNGTLVTKALPTMVTDSTSKTFENISLTTTTNPVWTMDTPNVLGARFLRHSATRILSTGARRTILMEELQFPVHAKVQSFQAAVVGNGTVYFQIWRLLDKSENKSNIFKLVAQQEIAVQMLKEVIQHFQLDEAHQFTVEAGDVLGFTNDQESSVIGYGFEPTTLLTSVDEYGTVIGYEMEFDKLIFPYQFALAATYTPTQETTSQEFPESSTWKDADALKAAVERNKERDSWWKNGALLIVILIWLVALTIAFIAYLVYRYCLIKKKKVPTATLR